MNLEVFIHYRTGIEDIDNEHLEILKIINLIKECSQDRNYERALCLFEKLRVMLVAHYTTEEELMERIQFPFREYHKTTHVEVLKKIENIKHFFIEGNLPMEEYVMRDLYHATLGHLDTMDRQYIIFYQKWKEKNEVVQ